MRAVFLLVATWLMLTSLPALGQGVDQQYIAIYATIQEADTLRQRGQLRDASSQYTDALVRLKRLQTSFPDWNPKIVSFRLNYLAGQIAAISDKIPAQLEAVPATPAKPQPVATATDPSAEVQRELNALRAQVNQLQADKGLLEAKLKEALAAQPAALDPRELAKAEERIRSLEKDADLLRVTLEQERGRKPAATDPTALQRLRDDLADVKRKLAEQNDQVRMLTRTNADLQQRLNTIATAEAGALAKAAERIKALELETQSLRASLEQARSQKAATDETEMSRLKQSLAEANRKLGEQTDLSKSLAQEKSEIEKRVQTLTAAATSPAAELAQTKQALVEANRRLAEQAEANQRLAQDKDALHKRAQSLSAEAEAVAALRAENELLKKQAAAAKAPAGKTPAEEELEKARARIAALQSDMEVLRAEKAAQENRVKAASAPTQTATDATKLKELESQRDELQKKLDAALRELVRNKTETTTAQAQDVARQLSVLRARIEVLEARPVPYTAEELAMMKRPEPRLAPAETKTVSKPEEKSGAAPAAASVALAAEAQRSFTAKQYDKAEASYRQVLRQGDSSASTLVNLAITQMEQNRLDEAEQQARQAVSLAPSNASSQSVYGQVKLRQGQYDAALDALSRAAQLNPQSAEIQNYLGITLSHKGLRVPAESALRKAIQMEPGYGSAHNNLAVIYLNQKPPMVELARWHYQKALAAGHPKNPELEKALETKQTPAGTQ